MVAHDERLLRFVQVARQRGLPFADIRALLQAAGWRDRQILVGFGACDPDLTVPEPRAVGTARETFLHLLAFTALYTWTIAVVGLLFDYVDLALPDPAWLEGDWWRALRLEAIRRGLATVVVAYPAFVVLWRLLLRAPARDVERARGVRRWLVWLSLFVGAVTLAADVVTLLWFLFEGELSLRFVCKAAALFVVTAAVLVYLGLWLRATTEERP